MKIFHFIDSMRIGGSEGQTADAAKCLVAQGHQVVIGCLHLSGPHLESLAKHGIQCIEFPLAGSAMGPKGILHILKLATFLRKGRFDVVHTHDLYSNLLAVPAAWLARTKLIISSRRDLGSWWWYTPRNRRILKWIQSLSHRVVANSQGVKDYLVREDHFRPEHIRVIRNAVDLDRFEISPERGAIFPNWRDDKIFAVVANMHTHTKGHAHLIEAAKQVCKTFPNARFALIGDGTLRGEFESKVSELGLQAHFVFLGARTDIPQILAAADAAILPSMAEGLPNAVLEYLAAGKPTIATSVGGIPEIIQHEKNGLLIPPGSPEALQSAIIRILSNPSEAAEFARAGRADMREKFSFERLVQELENLYGIK